MAENNSFLKELIERRVPQILGLYIAATWMLIEIGDWMVERFQFAPEITSYIFIGMAVLLPSVCYLAYQYGHPGPDPWKKPTFIIVPSNLILAIAAMFYLVNPVVATETRMVTDEKGVSHSFEVPKRQYQNNLANFFWKNKSGDSSLDWLQYGLPWLLSKDLDRSLFIYSYTPFGSSSIFTELKKSGFESGLNVPNSLQLKLARQRFTDYSINGAFDFQNGQYQLSIDIYRVESGEKIATHSVSGNDFLPLIDELTVSVKNTLETPSTLDEQTSDLPVAEHISESVTAIKKRVESNIKLLIHQDYPGAKTSLEEAIAEDFSFADGYAWLARVNQLMGNTEEAEAALNKALQHEYKFTTQDQFLFKGMAYGLRGDYVSQVKVYDMWIELFPDDIQAHETMARILLVTGLDHNKALQSLSRLRLLVPSDKSVLRDIAKLFILTGDLAKAIDSLNQYVVDNPQDTAALNELADVYERNIEFENARETLNKILLLDRNNITAVIKLVRLEIKLGNFDVAESRLAELLASAKDPREKFEIYQGYQSLYLNRGQIRKVIENFDDLQANSQHLPPIFQIFNIKFQKNYHLANIGQFEQALTELAEVKAELQAPLNGIVDVGILNVYMLKKDKENLLATMTQLESYIKQFPNPMFESVVDAAKAQALELDGEFEQAVKYYESSLKIIEGSVVNTRNEIGILLQKIQLASARTQMGSLEQAENELVLVISRYPSLALAYVALIENYTAQKEFEKAQASIAEVEKIWSQADVDYVEYKRYLAAKESLESLIK